MPYMEERNAMKKNKIKKDIWEASNMLSFSVKIRKMQEARMVYFFSIFKKNWKEKHR